MRDTPDPVWTHYYVGNKIRRYEPPPKFLHIGLLREFGHLLDPPVDGSPAKLAQRFKVSERRVLSLIRRYQRLTAERSIRKA